MRLTRIYQSGKFTQGEIIHLTPAASQHVGRVLRMKIGDMLTLFDGLNYEFLSKIVNINKHEVSVIIEESRYLSRESKLNINLAQCISKGDKMDLVIQKAVELGVCQVFPIISERCVVSINNERLLKKQKQWQDQAISACEQCGRNLIPIIHEPIKIKYFLEQNHKSNSFILSPLAEKSWHDLKNLENDLTILIGPEGGLSADEILLAEKQGFESINMGPRILRTETAAIAAISIIQALFGDI